MQVETLPNSSGEGVAAIWALAEERYIVIANVLPLADWTRVPATWVPGCLWIEALSEELSKLDLDRFSDRALGEDPPFIYLKILGNAVSCFERLPVPFRRVICSSQRSAGADKVANGILDSLGCLLPKNLV